MIVSRVQNSMYRLFSITWNTTSQPPAASILSVASSLSSGRPDAPRSIVTASSLHDRQHLLFVVAAHSIPRIIREYY